MTDVPPSPKRRRLSAPSPMADPVRSSPPGPPARSSTGRAEQAAQAARTSKSPKRGITPTATRSRSASPAKTGKDSDSPGSDGGAGVTMQTLLSAPQTITVSSSGGAQVGPSLDKSLIKEAAKSFASFDEMDVGGVKGAGVDATSSGETPVDSSSGSAGTDMQPSASSSGNSSDEKGTTSGEQGSTSDDDMDAPEEIKLEQKISLAQVMAETGETTGNLANGHMGGVTANGASAPALPEFLNPRVEKGSWKPTDDGMWLADPTGNWLFNEEMKAYFSLRDQQLYARREETDEEVVLMVWLTLQFGFHLQLEILSQSEIPVQHQIYELECGI